MASGNPDIVNLNKGLEFAKSGTELMDPTAAALLLPQLYLDPSLVFPFKSYRTVQDVIPLLERATLRKLPYSPIDKLGLLNLNSFLWAYFLGQTPFSSTHEEAKSLDYAIFSAFYGDSPAYFYLAVSQKVSDVSAYALFNAALRTDEYSLRKLSVDQSMMARSAMEKIVDDVGCDPTREGTSRDFNCLTEGANNLFLTDEYREIGLRILFSLAIDVDNSAAHSALGYHYNWSSDPGIDQARSAYHLKNAASRGDKAALNNLFYLVKDSPHLFFESRRMLIELLTEASNLGDNVAAKRLSRVQGLEMIYLLSSDSEAKRQEGLAKALGVLNDSMQVDMDIFALGVVKSAYSGEPLELREINLTLRPPRVSKEIFLSVWGKQLTEGNPWAALLGGTAYYFGEYGLKKDLKLAARYLKEAEQVYPELEGVFELYAIVDAMRKLDGESCATAKAYLNTYPATAYLLAGLACEGASNEERTGF